MSASQLTPLPEQLQPLATEMAVYYRELPRLLDEGEAGRYAVVKGETFYGTWDTFRDARQFGNERFSDGLFLTQQVDERFVPLLGPYFGKPAEESSSLT
jgi:hypothetical protein